MEHRTRLPFVLAVLAVLAACSSDDDLDARVAQPHLPDAPLQTIDAAPAAVDAAARDAQAAVDARPADAAPADAAAASKPAMLILNEVGSNQDGLHDLVELLAVEGGSIGGWKLEKDYPRAPAVLATLPDVVVAQGAIIVVHLEPAGTSAAAETTGVAQHLTADNYAGAWDFLGAADEIPYSNRILSLRSPGGETTSAVPFFRPDLVDPDRQPRNFPGDLQAIIDEGLWGPACAPSPCSYESNLADVAVSWTGSGTSKSGASVARAADAHGKARGDWNEVPAAAPLNTFGAPN